MKAIVLSKYGQPDVLELKGVEKPVPKDDEVLVEIHAASVNDWDWCIVRGSPFYIRLLCGLFEPKVKIPGVDIAGRVQAVGKDVTRFKPGDTVFGDLSECGFGGFAEYVCSPEGALTLMPSEMPFVEAAAIPHAATLALQGLFDEGNLKPENSLLINGAGGGVGTIAIQIARFLGVKRVTGVDHADKLEMMQTVGCDDVVDYTKQDFTDSDQRYDLILDTKTNRSILKYLKALNPNGLYVTVGGTTTRLLQAFVLGPLLRLFTSKRVRIVALKTNKGMDQICELIESGRIKPIIDGPYPLTEGPKAIQRFGQGTHKGKVILSIENVE